MDSLKTLKKIWTNSLGFLDNSIINTVIVVILVLYCSTIFDNINSYIGNLYNFSIVKLLVLLLIIYVAPKDTTVAILLALSYIISLHFLILNENFVGDENKESTESFQSFFPFVNVEKDENKDEKQSSHSKSECLKNYVPLHETVGDVCQPVDTFKNELNTQGLNNPEGFDNTIFGSPVV